MKLELVLLLYITLSLSINFFSVLILINPILPLQPALQRDLLALPLQEWWSQTGWYLSDEVLTF